MTRVADRRMTLLSDCDEWSDRPQTPSVDVWEDEPIGTLLGPDGSVLLVVYPPRNPIGFGR